MRKKSLMTLLVVFIITLAGCAQDNYATEEQVLKRLNEQLPNRTFQIIDYSTYTTQFGLSPGQRRIRYRVRDVETGIVFLTHFGHGGDFVDALWRERGVAVWSEGFQAFLDNRLRDIYPNLVNRPTGDLNNAFLTINRQEPHESTNHSWFTVYDLEFVENTVENVPDFATLKTAIGNFDVPVSIRLTVSLHIHVASFDLIYETERMRTFFREFILPLEAMRAGETENDITVSVNVRFFDNPRNIGFQYEFARFSWQYPSYRNNESITIENIDHYDFSSDFSIREHSDEPERPQNGENTEPNSQILTHHRAIDLEFCLDLDAFSRDILTGAVEEQVAVGGSILVLENYLSDMLGEEIVAETTFSFIEGGFERAVLYFVNNYDQSDENFIRVRLDVYFQFGYDDCDE